MDRPLAPLTFTPVYKKVIWGGRRMAAWRADLPDGPIGESWDLSDHPNGRSVVDAGPFRGVGLDALVARFGAELVGAGWTGTAFPLLVKLIDATERLSVQVHPDAALARRFGCGDNGKTECWLALAEGGELFHGARPGVDRAAFEQALAAGTVEATLARYESRAGDFFFLPSRTAHALGAGSLVYEVQETSDVTFRVYDWGRVGLDGRPRELHVPESLGTIDFTAPERGPRRPAWEPEPTGGETRALVACDRFAVEERRGPALARDGGGRCCVVTCLAGGGELTTAGGAVLLPPMRTALVPACAGAWRFTGPPDSRLLVSTPVW
jgi:mannose-6-phosphate isomerase